MQGVKRIGLSVIEIQIQVHTEIRIRLGVSRTIYVNVDSPKLGFPYFKKNTLYNKQIQIVLQAITVMCKLMFSKVVKTIYLFYKYKYKLYEIPSFLPRAAHCSQNPHPHSNLNLKWLWSLLGSSRQSLPISAVNLTARHREELLNAQTFTTSDAWKT